MRMDIQGIQEAQRQNAEWMAALRPSGGFGEAIRYGTTAAHRYAVSVTHVDTGALRASHRMGIYEGGREGRVDIDGGAANPRGQRPARYGVYEHNRGGEHAFYGRTVKEAGPNIVDEMVRIVKESVTR